MARGRTALGIWIAGIFLATAVPGENGGVREDVEPVPRESVSAWIDPTASRIADFGSDLHVELVLSQAVPWRAFTLDAPRRLVLDFGEVDFGGDALSDLIASDGVEDIRMGMFRAGWSRLVLALAQPMQIETAGMKSAPRTGNAVLKLQLAPTDEGTFSETAGAPESGFFVQPEVVEPETAVSPPPGERPLRVALDPGHGGIDTGAVEGSLVESRLMLDFSRLLATTLGAAGIDVVLTRKDDTFVPLAQRTAVARAAGADLLLSLHADELPDGGASGTAIYTLGTETIDRPSARLAALHDREDRLAGSDVAETDAPHDMQDDPEDVASRSASLADALAVGLARTTGSLHARPPLRAAFSVLQAPDLPSVLVELGFLSDPDDRARLTNPVWRANAAAGIRDAILAWAEEDGNGGSVGIENVRRARLR